MVLKLTLKKKWFDLIASGQKTEEYREIKPHWDARIPNREYTEIEFRNGYRHHAPIMRVEYKGYALSTWEGKPCYALQLGKVLELRNYSKPDL